MTLLVIWVLPGTPLVGWLHAPPVALSLLFIVVLITLGLFGGLALHALRRGHAEGDDGYFSNLAICPGSASPFEG